MLQIINYIIVYAVLILLLVAVIFYLFDTISRYAREGKEQRAARRGLTSSDVAGLIAATPDAAIIINKLGIIIQANGRAMQLFGYSDLGGQLIDMLLPEHLRNLHLQHRAKYFAGPRVRAMGAGLNLFGQHADGTVFPIEVSLSPLTVGNEKCALAIIRAKEEHHE